MKINSVDDKNVLHYIESRAREMKNDDVDDNPNDDVQHDLEDFPTSRSRTLHGVIWFGSLTFWIASCVSIGAWLATFVYFPKSLLADMLFPFLAFSVPLNVLASFCLPVNLRHKYVMAFVGFLFVAVQFLALCIYGLFFAGFEGVF